MSPNTDSLEGRLGLSLVRVRVFMQCFGGIQQFFNVNRGPVLTEIKKCILHSDRHTPTERVSIGIRSHEIHAYRLDMTVTTTTRSCPKSES